MGASADPGLGSGTLALLLLGSAACAVLALVGLTGGTPDPTLVAVREPGATAPHAPDETAAPSVDEAVETAPQASGLPETPAAAPPTLHVSGRVVSSSGVALESASAAASDVAGGSAHTSARTDTTGSFALPLPAGRSAWIRVAAAGFVERRVQLPAFDPGLDRFDLGTIELGRAVPLTLALIDEAGEPLGETTVDLVRPAPSTERFATPRSHRLRSDPLGFATLDGGIEPGPWELRPPAHLTPVGSSVLQLDDRPTGGLLAVELRRPRSDEVLSGRVVDPTGQGLEGATVRALGLDGTLLAQASSDPDGGFQLIDDRGTVGPVRLEAAAPGGFDPLSDPRQFHFGDTQAVLLLERATTLHLQVVDADDGTPVESFGWGWVQLDGASASALPERAAPSQHPDGEAILGRVPRGPTTLVVLPGDGVHAPSPPLEFHSGPSNHTLQVALERARTLTLQLRYPDGRPAAGSHVELLAESAGSDASPTAFALDAIDFAGIRSPSGDALRHGPAGYALRHARGTTDAQGTVVLHLPRSASRVALRASGAGHEPLFERGLDPRSGAIERTVLAGASLHGRVVPRGILERVWGTRRPALALIPGRELGASPRTVPIDGDGHFALAGLVPGPWTVEIRTAEPVPGEPSVVHRVGTLEIEAGTATEWTLDLGSIEPARLIGRLQIDGATEAVGALLLRLEHRADGRPIERQRTPIEVSADGRFEIDGLLPGTYGLALAPAPESGRGLGATAGECVELGPGQALEQTFSIRRGSLDLELTGREGQPLAHRRLTLRDTDLGWTLWALTDAAGRLRVEGLARGAYELCAPADDGHPTPTVLATVVADPRPARLAVSVDL